MTRGRRLPQSGLSFATLLLSAATLAACTAPGGDQGVDVDAGAAAAAPRELATASALEIIGDHAEFRPVLHAAAPLARLDSKGLRLVPVSTPTGAAWSPTSARNLVVTLPEGSDGVMRLSLEGDADAWIELRSEELARVPAAVVEKAVVFERAAVDTDVVHVASPTMVEEFRVLRTEHANNTFRWSMRKGPRVHTVRVRDGHFEIVDRDDLVVFQGTPVFAVDAKGARRDLAISVSEASDTVTLTASIDVSGLTYPIVVDPAWTAANSMSTTRGRPAFGLLGTKVIVAGGQSASAAVLSTAETWDTLTGVWASAGSMATARAGATGVVHGTKFVVVMGAATNTANVYDGASWSTTTLALGERQSAAVVYMPSVAKTLLVGGHTSTGAPLSTAEAYNGTSWTSVASMGTVRDSEPAAVWLPTVNKVLVFGGMGASAMLSSAELYNPATNTWAATGAMDATGFGYRAVVLPNGKVLVHSGWHGAATLPIIYDPATGTWSSAPNAAARKDGVAAVLSTGKVLLAAGYRGSSNYVSSADLYDPTAGTWTAVSPLAAPRTYHGLVALSSGRAIAFAGQTGGPVGTAVSTAEIFQQQANGQTCGANGDCTSGLCVDGYCCNSNCGASCEACDVTGSLGTCARVTGAPHGTRTDCGLYACQGSVNTCPTTCSSDAGCAAGNYCSGTTCVPKEPNGSTCPTGARECASGNCVDGVCCNSSCTAGCQACDVSGSVGTCTTVSGAPHGTRTCGEYLCPGGVTTCPSSCTADGACVSGYYCNGTSCVAKEPNGSTCPTGAHECTSNNCVDGVCCNSSCTSTCQACDVTSSVGTCTNVTGLPHGTRGNCGTYVCQGSTTACPSGCASESGCSTGNYCNGTSCVAKKANGSTCPTGAHECSSNNCVDGVCCNSACGSQCEACDVGGSVGTCVAVAGAPHGTRTVCPGTGACQANCDGVDKTKCGTFPNSSTICAAASCTSGASTPVRYCDGAGACASATSTACDPYICGPTACKVACASGSDCKSGYFCSGTTCLTTGTPGTVCTSPSQCASGNCVDGVCCTVGSCTAPLKCNAKGDGTCSKPLGTACGSGAECGSGNCVDGVCCNAACGGQCEACDVGGSVGTCVPVVGTPHAGRAACGGTGVCQATCNGSVRTSCGAYPGSSTVCAAATCDGSGATPQRTCDSLGSCATASPTSCYPYTCTGSVCRTSCVVDGDCTTGFFCNGGSCVAKRAAGATCTGGSQCSSGNCVVGVCFTTSSCTSPLKCNAKGDGTCSKPLAVACVNDTECGSGNCVDGVCCNTACIGQCEACDVGGSVGTCSPVAGAPHGGRTACVGTGACQASCTGTDRTKCGAPPGTSIVCGAPTCTAGSSTPTRTCDGVGNCATASTTACAPYVCGSLACKVSCAGDGDCASGYFCSGTVCTTTGNPGTLCTGPSQCKSGFCVDGVCCESSSCTAPLKCNAKGDGTCSKPLGATCAVSTECGSGFCADGVCCNAACSGQCEACDVGGSVGSCVAVVGTPHGTRSACTGTGVCQASCNGSDRSKCGSAPGTSTPCAPASCISGKQSGTAYCDGVGGCPAPTPIDCGPYQCGGLTCKGSCSTTAGDCSTGYACKSGACASTAELGTTCEDDTQCKSGHCTASSGVTKVCCKDDVCEAGKACAGASAGTLAGSCLKLPGQTCTVADDCLSNFCVDGVCCDTLCGGQCEACDVPGAAGKCTAVNGAPHGAREKCSDGGTEVCMALSCDGAKDRTKCTGFANGPDKECAPATCKDDNATAASFCDGSGSCRAGITTACGNYACGDKTCKTSCSVDTDCGKGFQCDAGKCVPLKATCTSDGLSSNPADKSAPKACAPFRCNPATGDCYGACTASDQCASPSVCDGTKCVPPPEGAAEESGGCAVGSARSGALRGAGLVAILALAVARRRRMSRNP